VTHRIQCLLPDTKPYFSSPLIRERTQAGLAAARGRLGGRPRKMTPEVLKMAMADPKTQASEVARRLGITTTTLYAYAYVNGTVKEIGVTVHGLI